MTRENTILRFCILQAVVSDYLNDWSNAADCFCHESCLDDEQYRNDGVSLQFIEDAVREKIDREKAP